MLLSKEVEIKWNASNKKYYESKGYSYTKMKDTFMVNIIDLNKSNTAVVNVKCDGCGKNLENITWLNYIRCVKDDGKYFCYDCAMKLYAGENLRKTLLKKHGKSFEQWCVENNRQDVLDRWDYELNNCKPSEICYSSGKKYWIKCLKGIHKSELKNLCNYVKGEEGVINCNQCNSFAQWGIDNICEDFLEKYWDWNKNKLSPWEISYNHLKKVWIKCQEKKYHGSYDISPDSFTRQNSRCPYCCNHRGKVHKLDSLGTLYPEVLNIWSEKNKKSPYEYAPMSNTKGIWWKCHEGKHEDYSRSILSSNRYGFKCPECIRERNESFLQEKVRLYLNKLDYIILHEYKCNIKCINPKTRHILPYDNEIVELKLIIEVHGEQHYKITNFYKMQAEKNNTTIEHELHMQQIRDRYKRIFAKSKGYEYLEIPYWTDNNEKTWKKLINDKIEEIKNKFNKYDIICGGCND